MPEINDYEEKPPTAASGTVYAHGTPQHEEEFTPWSRFVNANEGVSEREAGKLTTQVQGDVDKAKGELSSAQDTFNTGLQGNRTPKTPKAPASTSSPAAPVAAAGPSTNLDVLPDLAPAAPPAGPTAFGGSGATSKLQLAPQNQTKGQVYQQADTAAPPPSTSAPSQRPPGAQAVQPAADVGNPWASFLPARQPHAGPAPAQVAPERDRSLPGAFTVAPGAVAGHPTGAKDLETAVGAPAWSKLIGDTVTADQEAHALGGDGGVQALLQRNYGGETGGGGALDSALIGGAGGKAFRDLSRQYGAGQLLKNVGAAEGQSQGAWRALQGDVAARQALERELAGGAPAAGGAGAATTPTPDGFVPVAATKAGGLTGNPDDLTGNPGSTNAPDTWSQAEDAAWNDAVGKASQGDYAGQNSGRVEIAGGENNQGIGSASKGWGFNSGPSGGAGDTQGINVKTKNGKPDYSDWWGGSTDMRVGDPRIPAATWYALAFLSPIQRAKWFRHNFGGK